MKWITCGDLSQLEGLDVRISVLHQNMSGFKAPGCERVMNTLVFRLHQLWYSSAVSGPLPAKSVSVRFDPFQCQNRLLHNYQLIIMYLQMFENSCCVKKLCLLGQVFAWLDISGTIFSPEDICVSRPTNRMTHTMQVKEVQMCLKPFFGRLEYLNLSLHCKQ